MNRTCTPKTMEQLCPGPPTQGLSMGLSSKHGTKRSTRHHLSRTTTLNPRPKDKKISRLSACRRWWLLLARNTHQNAIFFRKRQKITGRTKITGNKNYGKKKLREIKLWENQAHESSCGAKRTPEKNYGKNISEKSNRIPIIFFPVIFVRPVCIFLFHKKKHSVK